MLVLVSKKLQKMKWIYLFYRTHLQHHFQQSARAHLQMINCHNTGTPCIPQFHAQWRVDEPAVLIDWLSYSVSGWSRRVYNIYWILFFVLFFRMNTKMKANSLSKRNYWEPSRAIIKHNNKNETSPMWFISFLTPPHSYFLAWSVWFYNIIFLFLLPSLNINNNKKNPPKNPSLDVFSYKCHIGLNLTDNVIIGVARWFQNREGLFQQLYGFIETNSLAPRCTQKLSEFVAALY